MTTDPIRDMLRSISEDMRASKDAPPPDKIDTEQHHYAVPPGDNKVGLAVCATCGKPPTNTGVGNMPQAFLFKNILSAKEYRISGMCQDCQDNTFEEPVEEWNGQPSPNP